MAGIIALLSNNSDVTLTPDGLRALAVRHEPREPTQVPAEYQVHRLSERLGTEQIAEIVRRYEAGESATKLAKEYGIAPSALLRLLRERNVVVRRTKLSAEQDETLGREYAAGATMAELEQKYRLSHNTVHRALRRVGVEMRAIGRRPDSAWTPTAGRSELLGEQAIHILSRQHEKSSRYPCAQGLPKHCPQHRKETDCR